MATSDLNPYLNRRPILDPREFHGRQSILLELLQRLVMGEAPQSCVVLGMRRIGKSSLLNYLQDPNGARQRYPEAVPPRDKSIFVTLDVAQFTPRDSSDADAVERQLLRAMLLGLIRSEEARQAIGDLPQEPERTTSIADLADTLDALLARICTQGHRILFLFDSNGQELTTWPESLASQLRYYFNNHKVGYVMASLYPLTKVLERGQSSDLFNVFGTLFLGPLSHRAAVGLLQKPLGEKLTEPWDEAFVAELLDELGTHPDLVKMAGARAWDLRRSTEQHPTVKQVLDTLQPDIESLFRSISRHLDDIQRAALRHADADLTALQLASPSAVKHGATLGSRFTEWMRRSGTPPPTPTLDGNRLTIDGRIVELTSTELQVMEMFLANIGKAVERKRLQAEIWSDLDETSKALDTTIQRLREKLGDDKGENRWIETKRGVGYVFGPEHAAR